MAVQKLTSEWVNRLSFTTEGQAFYRDTELRGFGVRVGTATKVYYAEAKVAGRTVRTSIGHHGVLTADEARKRARALLGEMAGGTNPNDAEKAKRARSVTLREAFDAFLAARKGLKPRTVYDYKRFMGLHTTAEMRRTRDVRTAPKYFADWHHRPVAEITKDMIEKRHAQIGATSQAQANLSMRFLRSLLNFAMAKYEDSRGQPLMAANPVKRLSQTKAWFRVERRQTLLRVHELKPWWDAVQALKPEVFNSKADVVKDYLAFLLLTGLRRQEAAQLSWENVDFKARTFTVTDTKNREDHTLPTSDFLLELLERRRAADPNGAYVFPGGPSSPTKRRSPGDRPGGYLVSPKKQLDKVVAASGVKFTIHDLRRTFITIAESLDIPGYALKRLVNHKMPNDVTAGYIVADVERLREPMQKITDFMLKAAGAKKGAQVVSIVGKRNTGRSVRASGKA